MDVCLDFWTPAYQTINDWVPDKIDSLGYHFMETRGISFVMELSRSYRIMCVTQ